MPVTIDELVIPMAFLSYKGEVIGGDQLVATLTEPEFDVDEEGVASFVGATKLVYSVRDRDPRFHPVAQTLSISEDVVWNDIPDILTDLLDDAFATWRRDNRLDYLEQIGG